MIWRGLLSGIVDAQTKELIDNVTSKEINVGVHNCIHITLTRVM